MHFDVFLSHNQQEKPWVRRLYQFLVQNGLKVFFDEVNVPPGADFISAIETAASSSSNLALVLSPGSLNSKWVGMETQLAMMRSIGDSKQSIIPIVLDDIDLTKVRPWLHTLNWVDLREPETRERKLRVLLQHFGIKNADTIPTKDLQTLLWLREGKQTSSLRVGGVEDIVGWGWDGIKLLEELIALDYSTTEALTHLHEGDPQQWGPIFMDHPDTWRMLFSEAKKIVGYWHMAPLFEDDYVLAKSGTLLDSEITSDRVQHFELPGHYNTYLVQVCMSPAFRGNRNTPLLFETFFEVLDELSKNGVFIKEVTANALTKTGVSLCKTFYMSPVCEHSQGGIIYTASIGTIFRSSLVNRFPELKLRYMQEDLLT